MYTEQAYLPRKGLHLMSPTRFFIPLVDRTFRVTAIAFALTSILVLRPAVGEEIRPTPVDLEFLFTGHHDIELKATEAGTLWHDYVRRKLMLNGNKVVARSSPVKVATVFQEVNARTERLARIAHLPVAVADLRADVLAQDIERHQAPQICLSLDGWCLNTLDNGLFALLHNRSGNSAPARWIGNHFLILGDADFLLGAAGAFSASSHEKIALVLDRQIPCHLLVRLDKGALTFSALFGLVSAPHVDLKRCIVGQSLRAMGVATLPTERAVPDFTDRSSTDELFWKFNVLDILTLKTLYLGQPLPGTSKTLTDMEQTYSGNIERILSRTNHTVRSSD